MAPKKARKPSREEFKAASSKELGRALRRKLPQRRATDLSGSDVTAASHAEEPSRETYGPPPPEDRAG
jgi:hypothetical protein